MIQDLTPELEALIPAHCKEWIDILDNGQPFNESLAREQVDLVYNIAEYKPPPIIVCGSPKEARLKAKELVDNYERPLYYGAFGSFTSDAFWVSIYEFLEKHAGLKINNEHWPAFKKLTRHSGVYETIPLDEACIVVPMPKYVKRDPQGRPHSLNGKSIEWVNGDGLYFIFGVVFGEELYNKVINPDTPVVDILSITNIEQRMAALAVVSIDKLLEKADAKLLDESSRGNRLYFSENLIPKEKVYFVRYNDPSTGREYTSFVDPELIELHADNLADRAMAAKGKLTLEEYLEHTGT